METRWEHASTNGGELDSAEGLGEPSRRWRLPAILVALVAVVAVVAIVAVLGLRAQRRSNLAAHEGGSARGQGQDVRESQFTTARDVPTSGAIDDRGTSRRVPGDGRSGAVTATSPQSADASRVAASPSPYPELPTSLEARLETLRQEAAEVGREVVETLRGGPEPLALRAMIHNRFGRSEEAAKCWQRCLDLDPDYADAHDGLGTIALEAGNNEQAAAHFRKALDVNPSLPGVRAALADALMSLGQMEQAAAVLEEDVRLFPDATGSHFRLGQAYLQQGEPEKAVESFEAALRTDADCTYAYYGLGNACRQLGQTEKSAECLRKFHELKRQDRRAEDQRMETFDDELQVRESVSFFHVAAGSVYSKYSKPRHAEAHWLRAVELIPTDTAARSRLAGLYRQQDRLEEASTLLRQLREIEPDDPVHCLNLGALLTRMKRVEEAEEAFQEARRLAPKRAAPYLALAQLYVQTGRGPAEVRQLAQKAAEVEPTAQNYAFLAVVCEQAGDLAAALGAIQRAVELDSANPEYAQILERIQQGVPHGGRG